MELTAESLAHGAYWAGASPSENYRSVVSRPGRVEKVDGLGIGRLPQHGDFSQDRTYGLTSQLRRGAVSVPSNIAEGQARLSTGEFRQFLGNARGSLMEIQTQILIACNLGYMKENESDKLLDDAAEVGRLLNGLLNSLH
jgi:four helix bundle protein